MANFQNAARRSTLALSLTLIGTVAMLYYHQRLFLPRVAAVRAAAGLRNDFSFGNDFYQVWVSSRALMRERLDPYSTEMTRRIQVDLYGRSLDNHPGDPLDLRAFPYPLYTDLLFWPLAPIPFPMARIIVLGVLTGMTLASVWLWLRALDWQLDWQWIAVISLLTLSSYPALEGMFAGQLGLLVAFLFAGSIIALQGHRFFFAGFLAALTTIKPQVTALAILYLLLWAMNQWPTRKRFIIGFISALALLVGMALVVQPGWVQSWICIVLAYRHYTPAPLMTEVLASQLGPRLSAPASLLLTAASIIAALMVIWRNRDAAFGSFAFFMTLSLLLVITTILLLPGQAVYDHLILLPGLLLMARNRERLRAAGWIPGAVLTLAALVLLWPWIAACALILVRPFLSPSIFDSAAVLALPIRTAASLPFALLAVLIWIWRVSGSKHPAIS